MNEVAVSEARSRLAEAIDESRRSGEPVSVTRRGRRVAVILGSEDFDRLVDSKDDAEDRRELDAARADDDFVPWDDVKAALPAVTAPSRPGSASSPGGSEGLIVSVWAVEPV